MKFAKIQLKALIPNKVPPESLKYKYWKNVFRTLKTTEKFNNGDILSSLKQGTS